MPKVMPRSHACYQPECLYILAGSTPCLQVGGPALAVIDHPNKGPCFGDEGLTIPLDGTRSVKTRLGPFYAKLPTGESILFPDQEGRARRTAAAQLKALKVAPVFAR